MAIINGMYIHVVDETVDKGVEAPSHPVEEGIGTTDLIRVNPVVLTLSGKIVDYSAMKSHEVLAKLNSLVLTGSLVSYRGRNVCSNMIIRSFSTSHPNTNNGGADFDMELQEIRIAQSSYGTKTSTDTNAKTEPTTNAGTQQVNTGTRKAIYHEVKAGESLWNITYIGKYYIYMENASPVTLGTPARRVQFLMDNNPDAFTKKGDASTLKVGARLFIGYDDPSDYKW